MSANKRRTPCKLRTLRKVCIYVYISTHICTPKGIGQPSVEHICYIKAVVYGSRGEEQRAMRLSNSWAGCKATGKEASQKECMKERAKTRTHACTHTRTLTIIHTTHTDACTHMHMLTIIHTTHTQTHGMVCVCVCDWCAQHHTSQPPALRSSLHSPLNYLQYSLHCTPICTALHYTVLHSSLHSPLNYLQYYFHCTPICTALHCTPHYTPYCTTAIFSSLHSPRALHCTALHSSLHSLLYYSSTAFHSSLHSPLALHCTPH